ncbi:MAG: ferredoxin [Actinobacteria bacterium]|nr:ferredoxin [Actinomycetota bacterium]
MIAIVDRGECIGCRLCEEICPDVFVLDSEGISTVIVDELPFEFEECAHEAEERCPSSAITLE